MTDLSELNRWTVTNGSIGPVFWCPDCDKQIGFVADRVPFVLLVDSALHHASTHADDVS